MFRSGFYDDFSYSFILSIIIASGLYIFYNHFEVTLICENENQTFEKKLKVVDYYKIKDETLYIDINDNLKLNINNCIKKGN